MRVPWPGCRHIAGRLHAEAPESTDRTRVAKRGRNATERSELAGPPNGDHSLPTTREPRYVCHVIRSLPFRLGGTVTVPSSGASEPDFLRRLPGCMRDCTSSRRNDLGHQDVRRQFENTSLRSDKPQPSTNVLPGQCLAPMTRARGNNHASRRLRGLSMRQCAPGAWRRAPSDCSASVQAEPLRGGDAMLRTTPELFWWRALAIARRRTPRRTWLPAPERPVPR
jgi:hypothetical protein